MYPFGWYYNQHMNPPHPANIVRRFSTVAKKAVEAIKKM